MEKCKPGLRWCPIEKKCIPDDDGKGKGQRQARGKGKGPLGNPTRNPRRPGDPVGNPRSGRGRTSEAMELVDVILGGKYKNYKKVQEASEAMEDVLDEVENKIDVVPDQDLQDLHKDVVDELTKDDGVTAVDEKIAVSISRLIREEEYRDFFKAQLKKYKIINPSDLDDEKKKEFFNTVDKLWKAKKESD